MKISLITVSYNSEPVLRTAIESVLAQQGVDLEYIVVDGGSSDGTVAIIQEYAGRFGDRMRWISENDQGMYDAINKGIMMATGDIVGILNSDDMLEGPDTLAHIAATFAGDVDGVYADIRFVKGDLTTTHRWYSARHWRPWMLQWGYMPPHPGVYLRRRLFGRYGLYKTDYEIAADYELLIRHLRMARLRLEYLGESVVKMRTGGKSTRGWRSNLKLNQEIVRGNLENGYFCCLPMLLPKYAFKIFEFILPRLGIGGGKR